MCKVMRSDFIESMHVAYVVVLDGAGQIVKNWGDPYYLTCVRSALKPFQASAAVATGATSAAGFTSAELALMCASHYGEDIHVQTAQEMLEKLGLEETGPRDDFALDAGGRNHQQRQEEEKEADIKTD